MGGSKTRCIGSIFVMWMNWLVGCKKQQIQSSEVPGRGDGRPPQVLAVATAVARSFAVHVGKLDTSSRQRLHIVAMLEKTCASIHCNTRRLVALVSLLCFIFLSPHSASSCDLDTTARIFLAGSICQSASAKMVLWSRYLFKMIVS